MFKNVDKCLLTETQLVTALVLGIPHLFLGLRHCWRHWTSCRL